MREIAWDRDIAIVNRLAAHRFKALEQLNFPVGLGVVFIPREQ
jgi:hypothetical protein